MQENSACLMFGKNLSGSRLKALVWASTILFLIAAVFYFLPVGVPFKTAFPLVVLAMFSLWLVPWQMCVAMAASAAGDFMGAGLNFTVQMECFAVAHLFLCLFFIQKLFRAGRESSKSFSALLTRRRIAYMIVSGGGIAVILLASMICIVPEVPSGVLRGGVAFYCIVISLMLFLALMQRSMLYALGAVLFVFSDFILAWNKFVEPVEYEKYLIMVPYYLGQWMIFVRSTPYRVAPSLIRSRL